MNKHESPADVAVKLLRDSSYPQIRSLNCTFHDGVLTLGGQVPNYHLKQVAQSAVRSIEGVIRVDNKVTVSR